jgi:hypothetical protein
MLKTIAELRSLLAEQSSSTAWRDSFQGYLDVCLVPELGESYLEAHLSEEQMERFRRQLRMESFFVRRAWRAWLFYPPESEGLSPLRRMNLKKRRIEEERLRLGVSEKNKEKWIQSISKYSDVLVKGSLNGLTLFNVLFRDMCFEEWVLQDCILDDCSLRNSLWSQCCFERVSFGTITGAFFYGVHFSHSELIFGPGSLSVTPDSIFEHCRFKCSVEDEATCFSLFALEDEAFETGVIRFVDCHFEGKLDIWDDGDPPLRCRLEFVRVSFAEGCAVRIPGYCIDSSTLSEGQWTFSLRYTGRQEVAELHETDA